MLLHEWKGGDSTAFDRLVPLIYPELRRLAASSLRKGGPQQTIEANTLVHEAYLRLVESRDHNFVNRSHFFAAAARVMRNVLVDNARARNAAKRKGGRRVTLDWDLGSGDQERLIVVLDDALQDLEKQDAAKARILELRYFGGLTAEESAEVLGLSVHQVNRQMRLALAWLRRAMSVDGGAAAAKDGAVESE